MSRTLTRSLVRAALLATLALPATALLPAVVPFTAGQARAAIVAEHKSVLAQYGTFQEHAKYGEVWIPSVTPQGWHPYQPCHWVYTKYGWHFDDKTPWGAVVHHYGRWTHEAGLGWIWVPGEEYSPGWVVWKTSADWVGWAPMPPDQDMKTLDAEAFNSDKMWIFMETAKFGKSCEGGIAPVSQVPVLLRQTAYVRDVAYVDGVLVFVFPTYLVGPVIDITVVNINVWSPIFIVNIVNYWNIVWNININVVIACPQPGLRPAAAPPTLPSSPPPPPKRADNPPPQRPGPGLVPVYPQRPSVTGIPKRPDVVVDRIPDPLRPGKPPLTGRNPNGPGIVVDTRPRPQWPRPIRPIDPGIGNGHPGGVNIGRLPKPIDPGFGRGPRPGIVSLPNGPVGKVGVAAPPSRFGFAGPISYPGGKGGVAGRSKPSGDGRFTAVPNRNLFAR